MRNKIAIKLMILITVIGGPIAFIFGTKALFLLATTYGVLPAWGGLMVIPTTILVTCWLLGRHVGKERR